MKVEIRDLELNKELNTKAKIATRGGLKVETTSALATGHLNNGCTAGTKCVCDIDGTDDGDDGGIFALLA
jgi:hypothetical protein